MQKTDKSLSKPSISIVMPVYNAARFLHACLDSILSQTFTNYEVIAVDDGSTDSSLYILKEYAQKDNRLIVIENKVNQGISKTINKAIEAARADYVCRMDADDIMVKNRLEVEYHFLKNNPEYVLVGGNVRLVSITGEALQIKTFPLEHEEIYNMLYTAMPVQHGTIMVDRTKLPPDFVWYEDGMNTAEEVELLFKLLNYGKFKNLDEILIDYRQHGQSITHRIPKEVFRLTLIAREKGVSLHNYKPTLTARMVSLLQILVVNVLPDSLIMPVFYKVRAAIILLNKLTHRSKGSLSEDNSRLIKKLDLQDSSL